MRIISLKNIRIPAAGKATTSEIFCPPNVAGQRNGFGDFDYDGLVVFQSGDLRFWSAKHGDWP